MVTRDVLIEELKKNYIGESHATGEIYFQDLDYNGLTVTVEIGQKKCYLKDIPVDIDLKSLMKLIKKEIKENYTL